ncbi:MAG TPA: TadE/TadG family type IV pilus assembly protein [Gemmataceae bacterium]|nr:TadE/TadG family type IV pilus assembly protein [Gemmataceae bacterium]
MIIRSNRTSRRGTSTVEFALVAPIFFMTVLGTIEIGRACMATELLTEAARRACRQGVLEGTSSSAIQQTASDYLTSVGINGETASVYVNDAPAGNTNVAAMPAYTEITVIVTVPINNVTWTPIAFLSGSLTGQYTMRRE